MDDLTLKNSQRLTMKYLENVIPLIMTSKHKVKYLGMNLTKKMKDLFTENSETLTKLKKTLVER